MLRGLLHTAFETRDGTSQDDRPLRRCTIITAYGGHLDRSPGQGLISLDVDLDLACVCEESRESVRLQAAAEREQ